MSLFNILMCSFISVLHFLQYTSSYTMQCKHNAVQLRLWRWETVVMVYIQALFAVKKTSQGLWHGSAWSPSLKAIGFKYSVSYIESWCSTWKMQHAIPSLKTWLFVWWAESKKEWTEYFINKALYKKKKSNLRHWRTSDAALSSYLKAC